MDRYFPTNSNIGYKVSTFEDEGEGSGTSTFDTEEQAKDFQRWFEWVNTLVIHHQLQHFIDPHNHYELAELFEKRAGLKAFFDALNEYDGELFTFKLRNPRGFNMGELLKAENAYDDSKKAKENQ